MGLLNLAWPVLLACIAALIVGGLTKGTTGIGLPLVAVPVLASFIPVPEALAVLVIPSALTSVYQAVAGGYLLSSLKLVWILVVGIAIGVPIGVRTLVAVDLKLLNLILGIFVVVFSSTVVYRMQFTVRPELEKLLGFLAGIASGVIGGISMFFGPIYAMFLAGLGINKDFLVAAIALTTVFSSLFLGTALALNGILGGRELILSLIAAIPVGIGLWVGQRIRARINELLFRKTLAALVFLIGLNLIRKGLIQ